MWNQRRVRVLAFALFECSVFVAVPAADAVHEVQDVQLHVGGYEWCSPGHNHLSSGHNEFHCEFARALFMGVAHAHVLPSLRPVTEVRAVPPTGNPLGSEPVLSWRAGSAATSRRLTSSGSP